MSVDKQSKTPQAPKLEMLPVGQLRPAEYNPHGMTRSQFTALKRIVQKRGMVQPIVVNRRTAKHGFDVSRQGLVVVGGHRRREVAIELGWTHAPCHVVEVHEVEERTLNLALNKIHGTFDEPFLADDLKWLIAADGDLEEAGFDDRETAALLAATEGNDGGPAEEPATPDLPKSPRTKPGEVLRLGRHRLLCGDAGDREALAALFDGQRAALVVTDPPYGVSYTGKHGSKVWAPMEGDRQEGVALEGFLSRAFRALAAHTNDAAGWYVWHSSINRMAFEGALRAAGVTVHQELVWVKNGITMGRCDYHYQHEPCLYGWAKRHRWTGDRKQSTVWTMDRDPDYKHPAQKPVELYRRAIMNSSKRGEIVVDAFAGSGPAVLAAEQTGRTCLAVEIDPAYCDVIRERWEVLSGDKAGGR